MPFRLKAAVFGRSPEARRFTLFLLTGGLSAAVNVVSRYLLSTVICYEAAVAIAYMIGMVVAFTLFRRFVFEQGSNWRGEFLRFTVVNVVGFCLVWVVSVGLVRLVFPAIGFHWHAEDIGHLIGVATPVLTSYYGHKHFSFRRSSGVAGEVVT